MDKHAPQSISKQQKTALAITVITCGLLSLLGFEVFKHHSSTVAEDAPHKISKPLLILDDDSESGLADASNSIGQTPYSYTHKETIQSLQSQLNENNRQLGSLRTQLLTQGSLSGSPKLIDLKKQLVEFQTKYQLLLEKKQLLKKELVISKEQLLESQKEYMELVNKKKSIKDHYANLETELQEQALVNQTLVKEIELLRSLLTDSQNGKLNADQTVAKLVNRINILEDELTLTKTAHPTLKNSLEAATKEKNELKRNLALTEERLKNLINHHNQAIRGNDDELTFTINKHKQLNKSLAVNIPPEHTHKALSKEAADHNDMWNQLAQLSSYGHPIYHAHAASNKKLQDKIEDLEHRLAIANDDLEFISRDNNELKTTIHTLYAELESARKHILIASDHSEHEEKLANMHSDLHAAGISNDALTNKINSLNAQLAALKHSYDTMQIPEAPSKELLAKIALLEQNLAMTHDEHADKLATYHSDLDASQIANEALTQKISHLNSQLSTLKEHYDNLQIPEAPSKELQDKISLLENNLVIANDDLNFIIDDNNALKANIQALNIELENAKQQKIADHEERMADMHSNLDASQIANEALTHKIGLLNSQITNLKQKNNSSPSTPSNDVLANIEFLEQHLASANADLNILNRENKAIKTNLKILHEEIAALKDDAAMTQDLLRNPPPSLHATIHPKKPPTSTAAQAAYMHTQVAQLGSSALNLCNRAPHELMQETLLHQKHSKQLEKQIAVLNTQINELEHQIHTLQSLSLSDINDDNDDDNFESYLSDAADTNNNAKNINVDDEGEDFGEIELPFYDEDPDDESDEYRHGQKDKDEKTRDKDH